MSLTAQRDAAAVAPSPAAPPPLAPPAACPPPGPVTADVFAPPTARVGLKLIVPFAVAQLALFGATSNYTVLYLVAAVLTVLGAVAILPVKKVK